MRGILALFCLVLAVACGSSLADATPVEPYPHLNSWGDKPAQCSLKPEEAVWLEEQIEAGNLRVATAEDVKAWEDMAKASGRPNDIIPDCGRTYVILKKIEILKKNISGYPIAFILPAEVEFPKIGVSSGIYDLKNGVTFQQGFCYEGAQQQIGKSSRDCK